MLIDQRFPDNKEIGLACIGDIHYGSQTCNEKALDSWIASVKKNKWYVILMGDLMENATMGSVGSVFEQRLTPQEQLRGIVDKLTPIKDYIIGGVSGNHGARTARVAGIDPDAIISYELGVPHYDYTAVGRIQVGKAHWAIVAHHGAGGGILQGSKLNMVKKLALIYPMADLYLAGHAHSDVSGSDRVFEISISGKPRTTGHIRHFSGTGSLLDYVGSYAEQKMFPPANLVQVVHFLGDHIGTHPTGLVAGEGETWRKGFRREVFHF